MNLALTDEQVATLTRTQREERVHRLTEESFALLSEGIDRFIRADARELAGVVTLFSGGNDSTVLAHLFRSHATHAAHANTTIGIEETRDFVRSTCEEWGLPLIEFKPPRVEDHYANLVLEQGFPGPGHHFKMFQRLKERSLRAVRNQLVTNPRRERVVFLAGRRRQESQRRASIPEHDRVGSIVYVSPLVNWTKLDMNTYRLMEGDVPRNRVSDLIHMSGECLCGCFAHQGERAEVSQWFPEVFRQIAALEAAIADREDIPDFRKTWGWGADPATLKRSRSVRKSKVGVLCSSCDARFGESA
jgi:3'-phosphoadenosine 5'-phosphosulfate sulfotransferase (PAPS reductase)/FAD synthetase